MMGPVLDELFLLAATGTGTIVGVVVTVVTRWPLWVTITVVTI